MSAARHAAILAGAPWFIPDAPCVRGHLAPRRTKTNVCTECVRFDQGGSKESLIRIAENKSKREAAIAARALAREDGRATYSTGQPCVRGHVGERRTNTAACVECETILRRRWAKTEKGRAARSAYARRPDVRAQYNAMKATPEWRERIREYNQSDKQRQSAREYQRKKRKTPEGAINNRMAFAIWRVLRGQKAGTSWQILVGYTLKDLVRHLERQFLKGMTWKNIGEWHIDHIIPLSSFRYDSPDSPEFRAAWALTNLRPLWAADNRLKKDKRLVLL